MKRITPLLRHYVDILLPWRSDFQFGTVYLFYTYINNMDTLYRQYGVGFIHSASEEDVVEAWCWQRFVGGSSCCSMEIRKFSKLQQGDVTSGNVNTVMPIEKA